MKQKDILLIVVIVIISGIFSYIISTTFIAPPQKRTTQVEVVEPISAEFSRPDERYFNANSINPTQQIQIGNQDNQQPF